MIELKGLVYRNLVAATLVILGIFIAGNVQAYYEGNPYAPQTQVICTNVPYYHCAIYDPSAAENPYAYQNPYGYTASPYGYEASPYGYETIPYGYGAGYMAGGGYNVDYFPNWSDRDERLFGSGAIMDRGFGGRR